MSKSESTSALLKRIRQCTICRGHFDHEPRPVLSWYPEAAIMLIGQAPGMKVHQSGVPWQDASGRLLREWLRIEDEVFYDPTRLALVPMGFCYPGKGKSGDLPPRPECAPEWHPVLRERSTKLRLTILIGKYAQARYLPDGGYGTLTENVRAFEQFLPNFLPLPHPSPRNRLWLKRNPWFEEEVLPALRKAVSSGLGN